jgi:hypothetical protein
LTPLEFVEGGVEVSQKIDLGSTSMTSIEESLQDQVNGILENVFAANEAYSLAFCIGQHADRVNKSGYGVAFRPVQEILSQHFVLSVTKLFEQPKVKYSTRSIPATVGILQSNASELTIRERFAMLSRFARIGGAAPRLQNLSDDEVTIAIIGYYNSLLPSKEVVTGFRAWRTLHALKSRRDKVIAHNESPSDSLFPTTTWGEARVLVDLAKSFVDVVSTGYLGFVLTDDNGSFFTERDSRRSTQALDKLLGTLCSSQIETKKKECYRKRQPS